MGFLAPAVPWLIKGGSALIGGWLGKKAQNNAMQRTPEEQQAIGGAQGAAGSLGRMGSTLFTPGVQTTGQGVGMLGNAGNYWQTLLNGNRAAMSQAVAGPRAALTDQFRGAERGLERSGVRGGVADLAKAELSRDRAGQIAGLTTGVQPAAAQSLGQVGSQLGSIGLSQTGQGIGATGDAANIWNQLLQIGQQNRLKGQETGAATGKGIGSFLFDILNGTFGKLGKKTGGAGIPGLPGGTAGSF